MVNVKSPFPSTNLQNLDTNIIFRIQSLVIFFGPWLVPRAIAYYRAIKNRPATSIKPLPQKTSYALTVLFISGVIAFCSTLPIFAPENVFRVTQSRLHTNTGVLFTRLAAVRDLVPEDEKLREVFETGGLEARLLYARYGPDVLLSNPLSTPGNLDAATSYLLYVLPAILLPHALHLFACGIATSSTLAGASPARWRTLATIAALLLPAAEIYYLTTYSDIPNARSVRYNDIDFLAWKLPIYRGLAIAFFDALLGWSIYLHATNRFFTTPSLSAPERVADHSSHLERLLANTRKLGVLRNSTVRDRDMRRKVEDYWLKESEVMRDIHEEPEVLEAQRNALRRIDTVRIGREAEAFVSNVLGPEAVGMGGVPPPVPVHAPGTVGS